MRTVWPCQPLGELCDVQIGKTPPRAESRFWGEDHSWLSISDMKQGRALRKTAERVSQTAVDELKLRPVQPGTVLLSFKLSIGKVGIASVPLFTNEAIAHLPIRTASLDRDYLYWALQAIPLTGEADRAAMGSTLNKAKLQVIPIPVPPIEEQRRIASALDAADALRAKRRQALAKLDTLTQAIFIDMFGDPVASCGPRRPLGEVAEIVTGNTPSRSIPEWYGDHLEWVKTDNILRSGAITPAAEKLSEAGRPKGREAPAGSTLVVCIAGSRSSIGRVGLLDRPAAFNQQINAVVPGPAVLPGFIFHQLRVGQPLVQRASTDSMKGMVSKSALKAVEVLVPPLVDQEKFCDVANQVGKSMQDYATAAAWSDCLFASLQQRAFRGEL